MTSDLLAAMVASARRSASERARSMPASTVARAAADRRPRGEAFRAGLTAPGIRVIAECKRRSPSRGMLRQHYDPAAIAHEYEAAGAAAISVLTEPTFFDGSLDHLRAVRASVVLPLLRKDFIVTDTQILEARAAGADAVLLIVGALQDDDLRTLLAAADDADLAALVEVHDREEFARAVGAGATVVGVNSRNLRTLEMNVALFDELVHEKPAGVALVAESGLKAASELTRLRGLGYDAFLMGERFMTEIHPGAALRSVLVAAAQDGPSR